MYFDCIFSILFADFSWKMTAGPSCNWEKLHQPLWREREGERERERGGEEERKGEGKGRGGEGEGKKGERESNQSVLQ